MKIEELKRRWLNEYEVDPDAKLDVTIKIGLTEKDGRFIAYIGNEDGYVNRQPISDTKDLNDMLKNYIDNDF